MTSRFGKGSASTAFNFDLHMAYCFCPCIIYMPWIIRSILGKMDLLLQIAAAGRSQQNACRNLHSLIHRCGLTLPLRIHTIEIPVKKLKPKVAKVWVHYPVILPSTWTKYLLSEHSRFLLGGHDLKHETCWRQELRQFWETYLQGDSGHPMSQTSAPPKDCTIPLYLHGDEGRGKFRLPIMVQAVQPVLSFKGIKFKNSSGSLIFEGITFSFFKSVVCVAKTLKVFGVFSAL